MPAPCLPGSLLLLFRALYHANLLMYELTARVQFCCLPPPASRAARSALLVAPRANARLPAGCLPRSVDLPVPTRYLLPWRYFYRRATLPAYHFLPALVVH